MSGDALRLPTPLSRPNRGLVPQLTFIQAWVPQTRVSRHATSGATRLTTLFVLRHQFPIRLETPLVSRPPSEDSMDLETGYRTRQAVRPEREYSSRSTRLCNTRMWSGRHMSVVLFSIVLLPIILLPIVLLSRVLLSAVLFRVVLALEILEFGVCSTRLSSACICLMSSY